MQCPGSFIFKAWLLVPALLLSIGLSWAAPPEPQPGLAQIRKGLFLVAESKLSDPNFSRTVVLLVEHGPQGSAGVIVNRPTRTLLSRIFPGMEALEGKPETLFIGGPVSHDHLVMLYRRADPARGAEPVFKDVYFSRDSGQLAEFLKQPGLGKSLRIYAGYAGWAPGQLQSELNRGDWRLLPADSVSIFETKPDVLWPEMNRRSSREFIRRRFEPPHFGPQSVH